MPSFISKEGVWEPAPEYVVDPNQPKGKESYEGPDRAAVAMLKEAGVESLGMHYSQDPDVVMRAKQMGFNSVKDYLDFRNYDPAKAEAAYQKLKATIITHADAERKPSPLIAGGGVNTVPGADPSTHRLGGYGYPNDAPRPAPVEPPSVKK